MKSGAGSRYRRAGLENRRGLRTEEVTCLNWDWKDGDATDAHVYLLPAVLDELTRCCRAGRLRIVDLGCGNGYATAKLASLGHEVIGVDVSRDGIEIARGLHPGTRFEVVSVYDDRLDEMVGGRVDVVVALEVAEHLYWPRKLFQVSCRLLVDGGLLLISTPYHGYLKNLSISLVNGWDRHFGVEVDGGHIKFFSKRTLGRITRECGFQNLRFRGVGRLPWVWKSMIMVAEKRPVP